MDGRVDVDLPTTGWEPTVPGPRSLRALLVLGLVPLAAVLPVAPAVAAPPNASAPVLVQLGTGQQRDFDLAVAEARALGGDVTLAYPPSSFVASLPPAAVEALGRRPAIARLDRGRVDPAAVRGGGPALEAAVRAWNTVFQGAPDPGVGPPGSAPPPPDRPDLLIPPAPAAQRAPGPAGAPSVNQTSEFMAGDIVYSVVFVESDAVAGNCSPADPQTEDWDASRRQTVLNEMAEGLAFWTSRAGRPSPVTFRLDEVGVRSTSCEPINGPGPDGQSRWIGDVLTGLGFGGNYVDAARRYADARRAALGADWAFTVFVVDSLNDTDGSFTDGYSAYAYLNGPFSVLTLDNGGWGIERFSKVFAHETGHTFGARDEYAEQCSTSQTSGYLDVANDSCNSGGITGDVSIMGSAAELNAPGVDVSTSARGAIGWRNPAPGAGVGSVVDVVRTSTASIDPFTPDPATDTTPTHPARAGNTPFPPGPGHAPVTVSRVASAERNLDGGPFSVQGVVPDDGAFDAESESYSTTPPTPATAGPHVFGTRATNDFGHVSPVATDALTISGPDGGGGPTVTARVPAPGTRGVAPAANVTATFSPGVVGVDRSTFTLTDAGGGPVAASVTYSSRTRTATLNPRATLAPDTLFRVTLVGGPSAIRDAAGNPLATVEWTFATGPAPAVTGRSPSSGSRSAARTGDVSATFSEAVLGVDRSTFVLTNAATGTAVPATVARRGATDQWILDPAATLAARTRYTVTLRGGPTAITDLIGNPLGPTGWSFTTRP